MRVLRTLREPLAIASTPPVKLLDGANVLGRYPGDWTTVRMLYVRPCTTQAQMVPCDMLVMMHLSAVRQNSMSAYRTAVANLCSYFKQVWYCSSKCFF